MLRVLALCGAAIAACSDGTGPQPSETRTIRAALTDVTARTYGFESLEDWSPIWSSPHLELSSIRVEGEASLAVSGGGWSSFISRALPKEQPAPEVMGFDLRLPEAQPNPDWLGTVELFIDAPSVGIFNQSLGLHELVQWTPGQWQRAEYAVQPDIQAALSNDYADLRFRIQLNVPHDAPGQYLFDRFVFGPFDPEPEPECPISDGNPCTLDLCDEDGQPVHEPAPPGTPCGSDLVCDGAGQCIPDAPADCSSFCASVGECHPDLLQECELFLCTSTEIGCAEPVEALVACTGASEVLCTPEGELPFEIPGCESELGGAVECATLAPDAGCQALCSAAVDAECGFPMESCLDACGELAGGGACQAELAAFLACAGPEPEIECLPPGGLPFRVVGCDAAFTESLLCIGACPVFPDGDPCTLDGCDPETGPTHTPRPAGSPCGPSDVCSDAGECITVEGCATLCTPLEAVSCPEFDPAECEDELCGASSPVCEEQAEAFLTCAAGAPVDCEISDSGYVGCDDEAEALAQCLSLCRDVDDAVTPCAQASCACTLESCEPEEAILLTPHPAGTACVGAGDCVGTCTEAGHCLIGEPADPCRLDVCTASGQDVEILPEGTPCGPADPCTGALLCDAEGGCVLVPAEAPEPGPCFEVVCDPATGFQLVPLAAGASCSDGNPCNGEELCDGDGTCLPGVPPDLDDGNECTVGSCDPATGVSQAPVADGTPCSAADACHVNAVCVAGACTGGEPVVCPPQDGCLQGACDPATGLCADVPKPDGSACNDGSLCTTDGSCEAGACSPGTPIETDDGNPCTVGSCDATTGIVTQEPRPAGTSCGSALVCDGDGICIPLGEPPPLDPPPIDSTVATTVFSATSWLYSGPTPVQTGVAEDTIDPRRAALVTGSVRDRDSLPLAGVQVTVHGHPELGLTSTRGDGTFDLVVNGGGLMTIDFIKHGYLESSRQIDVPWNRTLEIEPVVLLLPDPVVTPIHLDGASTDYQVARGSVITDQDGSRQATILFPPGVQALMHLPTGASAPLEDLSVRLTEYTVGEDGPAAMPATLPHNTAYTYAFEANADEAVAAGAPTVEFSEPLVFYTDNFLGFPAGIAVPLGSYDRLAGQWIPHPDGIVIDIVGVEDGQALLDLTGNGEAEDPAELEAFGIGPAEREQIAALYEPGSSVWRARIPHFTQPWDCNWPFGPPPDATGPNPPPPPPPQPRPNPCEESGSTIECQNQVLREEIPLAGTPFSLHYSTARAPGYLPPVEIPLSGPSVPASAKRIDLTVSVAGRTFSSSHPPVPDSGIFFTWDGLDKYGRAFHGRVTASVRVSYVYDGVYMEPGVSPFLAAGGARRRRFGAPSNGMVIEGSLTRQEILMTRAWDVPIRALSPNQPGLGGWTVNVHHEYEPGARLLHRGDGVVVDAMNESWGGVTRRIAGSSLPAGPIGDGGDARLARVVIPIGLAAAPDGAIYIGADSRIRRVGLDGIIQTFAGTGLFGFSGDGGPATEARIVSPRGIAIAPDGSVYFTQVARIRRVDLDGIISTVAGTGTGGFSGDGGPATEAQISHNLESIAFAPDGSLYIADRDNLRIRRVDSNGVISTVAGTGQPEFGDPMPDDIPALEAPLRPTQLASGPDGNLFIRHLGSSSVGGRVYSLGPDGLLRRVVGCREPGCTTNVDVPATEHNVDGVFRGLAIGPDGRLYMEKRVGGTNFSKILMVDTEGFVRHFSGGERPYRSGEAITQVELIPGTSHLSLDFGPAGLVYSEAGRDRVSRVELGLPGLLEMDELIIPSDDGSEFYVFSTLGRHLRTLHALTLAPRYTFEYDAAGLLSEISDEVGNVTRIERDPSGSPEAIIGPFGQQTILTSDADGLLASVTNPENEAHTITYGDGGLLETFTDPRGSTTTVTYNAHGQVTGVEDAAGAFTALTSTPQNDGWTVTRTTAGGRTTTYDVRDNNNGSQLWTNTFPDATQSIQDRRPDTTTHTTLPDGTEITTTSSADPRWGMSAAVVSTATRLPSGLERVEERSRSATLANPIDPTSLQTLVESTTVNGLTQSTTYTASDRRFTTTSPAGRTVANTLDELGRLIQAEVTGTAPVDLVYDALGRLTEITQGSRTTTATYDPLGHLETLTNALLQTETFEHDAAGRMTARHRPDGNTIAFAYDPGGLLTSVTPPGRPPHLFTYNDVGLLESYTAPDAGSGPAVTSYEYDPDKHPIRVVRPDGTEVTLSYDPVSGKMDSITLPTGTLDLAYDPTTGLLATVTSPDGVLLDYTYDGSLLTSTTWSGPVSGQVNRTYDDFFRLATESVNGASTVAFGYDDDGLLTSAGDLSLGYGTQNTLLQDTALGGVTDSRTYDGFGELSAYTASFDSSPLYSVDYERDALGRIVQKTETLLGETTVFEYGYDDVGRLITVAEDGLAAREYEYDANGNRIAFHDLTAGTTIPGTYDDQDRLLAYGDFVYTYTEDGSLRTKTDTLTSETTIYTYDALGNLKRVELPDGRVIDYLVDGNQRRVMKLVDGVAVKGWLYRDDLRIVAELDGEGEVVSRFVWADGAGAEEAAVRTAFTRLGLSVPELRLQSSTPSNSHAPAYAVRDGNLYRLLKDHLGTPRVVVDVTTGAIVKRLGIDEWGQVLGDTNPELVPFKFAGGLYDEDTGLVRFGARDYDPETGRWTAKDPILFEGGDTNLYAYAAQDPVNMIDSLGLNAECIESCNFMDWVKPDCGTVCALETTCGEDMSGCMSACETGRNIDFVKCLVGCGAYQQPTCTPGRDGKPRSCTAGLHPPSPSHG